MLCCYSIDENINFMHIDYMCCVAFFQLKTKMSKLEDEKLLYAKVQDCI